MVFFHLSARSFFRASLFSDDEAGPNFEYAYCSCFGYTIWMDGLQESIAVLFSKMEKFGDRLFEDVQKSCDTSFKGKSFKLINNVILEAN